ncbi:MAG TPA: BatA domain-containing protein [Anaerolineales bacterium]|nr:BatA domain-containing protein [Anaerolineales bacterium]
MNFLNPLGLWFLLFALPIVLLYLLKIRRKDYEISSTMLWRMALRDKQANAPWQKLRRNLLLLLQLVILSALVFAVARLAFPVPAIASGSIVLLIDGSASMRAQDVSPDRFTRAIEIAAELVRSAGSGTTTAAILAAGPPSVLFSGETDRSRAVGLLAAAEPGAGEADWAAAFSLAAGLGRQEGVEDVTFVLISDGGLPEEGLPSLPGPVEYVSVGTAGDNLAISALAARPLPAGGAAELFVRVSNYGDAERSARLTIIRNGEPLFSDLVHLRAGESGTFVFDGLPAEASRFEAGLENIQADLPLDPLPLDDSAYAVLSPPPVRSVLLVSQGNLFLERLLLLFPNLIASRTVPGEDGEIHLPAASFDLYIFDGLIPGGELPDGQLLLIDPPENPLFVVTGSTEEIEPLASTAHPLGQFVDWDPVNVYEIRTIERPAWGEPLAVSGEHPLVFIGRTGGRRVAVVAFDLHRSDLPLQIAFPILFANLFAFLAPQGIVPDPNIARPGVSVALEPPPGTLTAEITGPDGTLHNITAEAGELLFTDTARPGFYTVRLPGQTDAETAVFAVNLFSEAESRIAPAGLIRIGETTLETTRPDSVSNRELWGWLVLLALAFLMVEWLVYHRRLGKPEEIKI